MELDVLLPLTLFWRGVRPSLGEAWHLLSLRGKELDDWIDRHYPHVQKDWREAGQKEFEWCQKHRVNVVSFFHPKYISSLKILNKPPLLLCVLGDLDNLNRPALTIVGGRQVSLSAAEWLDRHLPDFLKYRNVNIISGGARGVDQKAHVIAVREGAPTWVHLPSGMAELYPENLMHLREDIEAGGGGMISAYGPFTRMRKNHFHERNYSIALHGNYTLVLEARRRSGTLITAAASLDYGRGVGTVPWGPHPISLGGLDLLRDGADLITNSDDLKLKFEESVANDICQTLGTENSEPIQ